MSTKTLTQAILDTIQPEDKAVADLIQAENLNQRQVIRLIPSENYASPAVSAAMASSFGNRYSEGYPHRWKDGQKIEENGKYYCGQQQSIPLERLTMARALELFGLNDTDYHVNVQPLSGAPANLAVLTGLLQPGDTFLGPSLACGGHLTHGHPANLTGKLFHAIQYGLNEAEALNYDEIEKLAMEHKPKLILCGTTAYPLQINFERFGQIAKKCGALLMADIAHISGLCATGVHPSPFPHADIVTTTTHKVLRGPRGGMIYCRKNLGETIDKAIIPGLQGGPHMNAIAALAIALKEANTPEYKAYAQQVVKNAKRLADKLKANGFHLVGGGTENHLILIDCVKSDEKVRTKNGTILAYALEEANIVCNKNSVPGDPKPWNPSGIRLGTPATTTIGLKEVEMERLAEWITRVAQAPEDAANLATVKAEVVAFMDSLNLSDRFAL